MNELQIFENKDFGKVRVVKIAETPYFVGKDVAEILGYSNSRKAVADHVDDDDKKDGVTIRDSIGREQKPILINESGLYSLILSSKLPTAKKFKHWVTSEVLPTIYRYGMYATEKLLKSPEFLLEVAKKLKADKEKIAVLEGTVEELAPKASYCDIILGTTDLMPVTLIAKDYGKTAQWLNRYLADKGVQHKIDKTYVLNQKFADKGYTGTKTFIYRDYYNYCHSSTNTLWTQKGRLFIYELLKKDNILPLVETA